jgi:hypothetical protein
MVKLKVKEMVKEEGSSKVAEGNYKSFNFIELTTSDPVPISAPPR